MKLLKYHGSGNDFIIFDEIKYGQISCDEKRRQITKSICNRENSLGADGVLFVQRSNGADVKMRIFNSDGSEAEMCGNGLRCFSRYIMDEKEINELSVETLKKTYRASKNEQFSDYLTGYEIIIDNVCLVDDRAVLECFRANNPKKENARHLTVSNPHLVIQRKELINDTELELLGKINNDTIQGGINSNYYTVVDADSIYVRTYERGAGITLSCGTGMTSSTAIHCVNTGYIGKWLNVYNDGGKVLCKVIQEEDKIVVHFVGNATYIMDTEVQADDILDQAHFNCNFNMHEASAYESFFKQTRKELKDKGFNGYKENMQR